MVGCFKWRLVGQSSRNMEGFVAENDLNCTDLAQEVSVEKKFTLWPRDCLCVTFTENVTAFAFV